MPIPSSHSSLRQLRRSIPDAEHKPTAQCPDCGSEDCSSCRRNAKRHKAWKEHQQKDALNQEEEDDCNNKPIQQEALVERRNAHRLFTSRAEDEAWVDISTQRLPNSRLGSLYPGSRFRGKQKCGITTYDVLVDIQHVNLKESTLSGYLNIKGLTTEFPELTTFFEGEIIGPKYSFLTRKWQAQLLIDEAHWKRFPSFLPYLQIFNRDDFTYDPTDNDFVYMRWKERFLVPDHRVDTLEGASFAGFYYICYQRSTDQIKGYYFFRHHTQWYQELSLEHVKQNCFGNFELR